MKNIIHFVVDRLKSLLMGTLIISLLFLAIYNSSIFTSIMSFGGSYTSGFDSIPNDLRYLIITFVIYWSLLSLYYVSSVFDVFKKHETATIYFLLPMNLFEKYLSIVFVVFIIPLLLTIFLAVVVLLIFKIFHHMTIFHMGDLLNVLKMIQADGSYLYMPVVCIMIVTQFLMGAIVFRRFSSLIVIVYYFFIVIIFSYFKLSTYLEMSERPLWLLDGLRVLLLLWSMVALYFLMFRMGYQIWSKSLFSSSRVFLLLVFLINYFLLFLCAQI